MPEHSFAMTQNIHEVFYLLGHLIFEDASIFEAILQEQGLLA
jgi:hypothetical protein